MYPETTSNSFENNNIIVNSADQINTSNLTGMKRRELAGYLYLNIKKNMENLVSGGEI